MATNPKTPPESETQPDAAASNGSSEAGLLAMAEAIREQNGLLAQLITQNASVPVTAQLASAQPTTLIVQTQPAEPAKYTGVTERHRRVAERVRGGENIRDAMLAEGYGVKFVPGNSHEFARQLVGQGLLAEGEARAAIAGVVVESVLGTDDDDEMEE